MKDSPLDGEKNSNWMRLDWPRQVRLMALLTKIDSAEAPPRIAIGIAPWVAAAGRAATVAAAAVLTAASFYPYLRGTERLTTFGLATVILVAALFAAYWRNSQQLDLESGTCRSERGFTPWTRCQETRLARFDRVEIRTKAGGALGTGAMSCSVRLVGPGASVLVIRGTEAWVLGFGANLAERAGLPLIPVFDGPRDPSAALRIVTTGGIWLAMGAVVTIMIWPVLGGRRPMHLSAAAAQAPYSELDGALRLYYQGRFSESEKIYRSAIERLPNNSDLWNMLAYACAAQGKLDDAMKDAEHALALAPDSGNILDTVGEMHERRKELLAAVDYYEMALKRIPPEQSQETRCKYGRTLLALHRREEALPLLRDAADGPPTEWGRIAASLLKRADPTYRPQRRTFRMGGALMPL